MKLHASIAAAVTLGVAATAALAAGAEPSEGMRHVKEACGADLDKYCANVEPGGGRIKSCVKHHWFSLSHDCKTVLLDMRRTHQRLDE